VNCTTALGYDGIVTVRPRTILPLLFVYGLLVPLVAPALLWFGLVDLPDEYLEFAVSDLAFWSRELSAGHLPHWNPYKLGGMPVFADPTCLAPWYPLAWLLPLVPLNAFVLGAWVLHLALGATGVHTLCRSAGGRATAGGLSGALYLCSTTVVAALVDGQLDVVALLGWLPWALLAIERAALSRTLRAGCTATALGGLALGLVGLGSHPRFAAFAFVAVGVHGVSTWALAGRRPPAAVSGPLMLGALALGTIVTSASLLPAALEVLASRSGPPPDAGLVGQALSPVGLAGLVYPRALLLDERWYHAGVGVLLLGFGLGAGRTRQRFLLSATVLLLVGMGLRGPLGWALRPVLWLIYPVETGAAAMAAPLLAVAIGLAMDRLVPSRTAAVAVLVVGGGALAMAHVAAGALYMPHVVAVHRLGVGALVHGGLAVGGLAALLAVGERLGRARFLGAVLALLLADGLAYAWRVQDAIPTHTIAPSDWVSTAPFMGLQPSSPPGRSLQLPATPTRDFEHGLPEDLFSAPGHGWGHNPGGDPTTGIPREVRALLGRPLRRNGGSGTGWPQVGGRALVPPMPWSVLVEQLAHRDPSQLAARLRSVDALGRALDVLRVRWVHSSVSLEHPRLVALLPSPAAPDVLRYEVRDPRPPGWLAPRVQRYDDANAALAALLDGPAQPGRDTVLLVGRDAPTEVPSSPGAGQEATVTSWRPGAWTLSLPAHQGGVLTVAERYHPGWRATDPAGRSLPTLRADLVDLGVLLQPSHRQVTLTFVAPGARTGMLLSLLGLGLAAMLLWGGKNPRRP